MEIFLHLSSQQNLHYRSINQKKKRIFTIDFSHIYHGINGGNPLKIRIFVVLRGCKNFLCILSLKFEHDNLPTMWLLLFLWGVALVLRSWGWLVFFFFFFWITSIQNQLDSNYYSLSYVDPLKVKFSRYSFFFIHKT